MTDLVTIALISSGSTTLGLIITGLFNSYQNRKISSKVDGYHKEVNGKMGELLEVSKSASKAEGILEGRAVLKEEQKDEKDHHDKN
jgi:hypothetical protein